MARLLVRGVPDGIVAALEQRAKRHGRSVEAEHREILLDALVSDADVFWAVADHLRSEMADREQYLPDSAALIREERDKR